MASELIVFLASHVEATLIVPLWPEIENTGPRVEKDTMILSPNSVGARVLEMTFNANRLNALDIPAHTCYAAMACRLLIPAAKIMRSKNNLPWSGSTIATPRPHWQSSQTATPKTSEGRGKQRHCPAPAPARETHARVPTLGETDTSKPNRQQPLSRPQTSARSKAHNPNSSNSPNLHSVR